MFAPRAPLGLLYLLLCNIISIKKDRRWFKTKERHYCHCLFIANARADATDVIHNAIIVMEDWALALVAQGPLHRPINSMVESAREKTSSSVSSSAPCSNKQPLWGFWYRCITHSVKLNRFCFLSVSLWQRWALRYPLRFSIEPLRISQVYEQTSPLFTSRLLFLHLSIA